MPSAAQTPPGDFLPRLGAGCLVLLGAFVIVSMLFLVSEAPGQGAGSVVMGLTGVGLLGAGVFWWRFVSGSERHRQLELEEKEVLLVAARHGGAVTVAQLALESNLTAMRAEEALARMCSAGLAHPDLLEDGTVQYRFGGLMGRDSGTRTELPDAT